VLLPLTCFKAYDVRGRVPDQLNEDSAYRIGRAFAAFLSPRRVVVGHDIRLTSKPLCDALTRGLLDAGVDVYDIGLCGTEEVYFATGQLGMDGGIVVTASHNPKDYNGMKFVREGSRPISGDTGLDVIRQIAERNAFGPAERRGTVHALDTKPAYIEHLLGYVDRAKLKPLTVVCNAGNGGAGRIIDLLEPHLPFRFIKLHHEPNGDFPHGVPNPLLEENRQVTSEYLLAQGADLAIAWDGDFDRCFLFDEDGNFIEGYYIVGLLAELFLRRQSGGRIIHDPRLVWNTQSVVERLGGTAVQCKSGHAFIKEKMRAEDAVYGGEMSAHHYFRDFFYCDSGKSLSRLIGDCIERFPASGEINRTVADADAVLARVMEQYRASALAIDSIDGISLSFSDWRFNLRRSNTEPVIRLNVETRGNRALMERKTAELLALLH